MSSRFLKPKTLEDALQMKKEFPGSLFLGGGTDINNPASMSQADYLISLDNLNLKACVRGNHNTILGASTTFQELIDWDECHPALKEAAGYLYSRNVRNMATVGGNIGVHLKKSYLVPVLMVLEADLELGDQQIIPLRSYVKENRHDLILNIRFARSSGKTAVKQITRSAGGETVVSAAVYVEQKNGKILKSTIAVGGFFDRVVRLNDVEDALVEGRLKTGKDIQDAVAALVQGEDDYLGSAAYKKYICGIIVADCVARCMREDV